MIGDPIFALFVSNMAWSALAMLLVLAVRRPFAALFGAGPAYALWLLPALRLLAPPLPAWSLVTAPIALPTTVILVAEDTAAPMPLDGGPGQWVPILLAIWAVGAAVFICWQAWTHYRFLRALDRGARPLGRHGGFALVESPAVVGPISVGAAAPADRGARSISKAAIRRANACWRSITRLSTTAAATCGGTISPC